METTIDNTNLLKELRTLQEMRTKVERVQSSSLKSLGEITLMQVSLPMIAETPHSDLLHKFKKRFQEFKESLLSDIDERINEVNSQLRNHE